MADGKMNERSLEQFKRCWLPQDVSFFFRGWGKAIWSISILLLEYFQSFRFKFQSLIFLLALTVGSFVLDASLLNECSSHCEPRNILLPTNSWSKGSRETSSWLLLLRFHFSFWRISVGCPIHQVNHPVLSSQLFTWTWRHHQALQTWQWTRILHAHDNFARHQKVSTTTPTHPSLARFSRANYPRQFTPKMIAYSAFATFILAHHCTHWSFRNFLCGIFILWHAAVPTRILIIMNKKTSMPFATIHESFCKSFTIWRGTYYKCTNQRHGPKRIISCVFMCLHSIPWTICTFMFWHPRREWVGFLHTSSTIQTHFGWLHGTMSCSSWKTSQMTRNSWLNKDWGEGLNGHSFRSPHWILERKATQHRKQS